MTAHSPTPWSCDDAITEPDTGHRVAYIYEPSQGDIVAQVWKPCGHDDDEGIKANARHIVRCVNCHDELLAALNECLTSNNAQCIVTNDVAYMMRRFKAINKIVDAAIAKATQ